MRVQGLVLPLLALSLESRSAPPAAHVPESCAATRARGSTFVPPPPYAPAAPFHGRFWYGTEALWAMPSADGLWHGLVTPQGIRVSGCRTSFGCRNRSRPTLD
jgi:hypothetical protein